MSWMSTNSDFHTHIRIDPTIKSLLPYLQTILSNIHGSIKVESSHDVRNIATKLGLPVETCQACNADSRADGKI